MKVVQITTSSKGGAGIAALRLHRALREQGVSSAFVAKDLTIDFDGNSIADDFFAYKKPKLSTRAASKLKRIFDKSDRLLFQSRLNTLKPQLDFEMISSPFSVFNVEDHPIVKQANLINLHWVGGMIDYQHFFASCRKPLVWTLHDMNPFLGLFHYEGDHNKNQKIASELDQQALDIKRRAIQQIERGALVTPSAWMLNKAKHSGVFECFLQKKCIPNSIDLDVFSPGKPQNIRRELGIGKDEFALLFVCHNIQSTRKGIDLLLDAFTKMNAVSPVLFTIGKKELPDLPPHLKIISLGEVNNAEMMAKYYTASDAFILPSREDNLPNVMLESFACGKPVISFANGGMAEHVIEGVTGCLSAKLTGDSLAEAIDRFYSNKENYSLEEIRSYAEDHFNFASQALEYIQVYEALGNNRT